MTLSDLRALAHRVRFVHFGARVRIFRVTHHNIVVFEIVFIVEKTGTYACFFVGCTGDSINGKMN